MLHGPADPRRPAISKHTPSKTDRRDAPRRRAWPWLALILAAAVLPRVPILCNAAALFNSDEAVNALVIQHLLSGRELTLFNWGATYYGIVEGLLALPFIPFVGTTALAFKLGALAGFLLLVVAVFLLGRDQYGPGAGLWAAALLIAFSPQLVFWSTLASVGTCLVVAWGTLTFLVLARWRRAPSAAGAAGLGFMLGFGLYIYQLYLVYLAALLAWSVLAWRPWQALPVAPAAAASAAATAVGAAHDTVAAAPAPATAATAATAAGADPGTAAPAAVRGAGGGGREIATRAVALAAGFALGVLPRLALVALPHAETKEPSFSLGLAHAAGNATLLLRSCLPGLLGLGGGAAAGLAPPGRRAWALALPLVLVLGAALVQAAWQSRRELPGPLRRACRPAAQSTPRSTLESLLVALVAADVLLFLVSPNPQDELASRYLLPCVTSLAVLGGAWLDRIGHRRAWAGAVFGALVVLLPAVQLARWYRSPGPFHLLGRGLRIAHRRDDMEPVFDLLRRRQLRGAYGGYWTAYRATFLSGETILVAPYRDWDRYPPYTRAVDRLPDVAYVFQPGADDPGRADFLARLGGDGARRAEALAAGPYVVYLSRDGRRLLPPLFAAPVVRLRHPAADVAATGVPTTARTGERLAIRVRAVNRSDAAWSAAGVAGGLRVAVAYHWQDPNGRVVVWDGERSPLPRDVRPGEAVEAPAQVIAPPASGRFELLITLIQEGGAWFDQATGSATRFEVQVRPAAEVSTR